MLLGAADGLIIESTPHIHGLSLTIVVDHRAYVKRLHTPSIARDNGIDGIKVP
jgi:hypothetical protein